MNKILKVIARTISCGFGVLLALSLLIPGVALAVNGAALFSAGDYAAAAVAFDEETSADPGNADAWFLLGVARQRLGEHAAAVTAFERVLTLAPDDGDVQLPLGISRLALKDAIGARTALLAASRKSPEDGSVWLSLGLAQQALGQDVEALHSLQTAAERDPDLRQIALLNAGLSERRLGNHYASIRTLHEAVNLNPTSDIAQSARDLLSAPFVAADTDRPWQLELRAGAEYDDNVSTSETDVATGEQDVAAVFEISAEYAVYHTDKTQLEFGYDFYQSLYSRLDDFDLQLHTTSAFLSHQVANVDVGFSYQFTHASLGDESFFDTHRFRPSVGFSLWESFYHSVSYSFADKDFVEDDDRDADQHGVNFDSYYFFPGNSSFAFLGARVEDEDTRDAQFDYLGYYVNTGLTGTIDSLPAMPATVNFGYQYFLRDYHSTTPSLGEEREDKRHTLMLNVRQPLNPRFALLFVYQYISADSNLAQSDFTENIATLNLEFAF